MTNKISFLPDIHRMLPQSPEAERAILGCFLQFPTETWAVCRNQGLEYSHFHIPSHGTIFRCIVELIAEHKPVDFATVASSLRDDGKLDGVGGAGTISSLFTESGGVASNLSYYIGEVKSKAQSRNLIALGAELASRAYEEDPADLTHEAAQRIGVAKTTAISGADEALPLRSLYEIEDYQPDPKEEIWPGGLLSMGLPTALIGAPGVGKSRISIQAAICTVLGLPFIDFPTHGAGLKWLFLQTENSMRRLKHDFGMMTRQFDKEQRDVLNEHIRFLDIGSKDFGSICMTDGHPDKAQIMRTMMRFRADVVVIDPLRDAGLGDLNKDADMTMTCRGISATLRACNPKATPFVIHHGRTGTAEGSRVYGGDAASFARNSKVLLGWIRSQINVAAAGDAFPDTVIFGCGKCSDGRRWDPFAATLNPDTMTYTRDLDFDLDAWSDSMIEQSKKGKGKVKAMFTIDNMLACLSETEWVSGATWFAEAEKQGCAKATFNSLFSKMQNHPKLEREGKIFRRRP